MAPYKHGGLQGGHKKLYSAWLNMRTRCNNPRCKDYPYYGGRGIGIDPRWDDFLAFVADVGPHPGKKWTVDRVNNDGDYGPKNFRWATRRMQSRNRPYYRIKEIDRLWIKDMCKYMRQIDVAARMGISQTRVSQIVRGQ